MDDHYFALRLVDFRGKRIPEERFLTPFAAIARAKRISHSGGTVIVVEEADDPGTAVVGIRADGSLESLYAGG